MSATFNPPTQLQAMPDDRLWSYVGMPVGVSVLLTNGHYVDTPTPSHDELAAAGVEGTDWFRGGYVYHVTTEVEEALLADGYEVSYTGWGEGENGGGGYGDGGLF